MAKRRLHPTGVTPGKPEGAWGGSEAEIDDGEVDPRWERG